MKKICITLLSLFSIMIIDHGVHEHNTFNADNVLKLSLYKEVNDYISSKTKLHQLDSKLLVDLCFEYDIDIIFVLAQGQIESLFGTKGIASKTNSVWNIGSYDGRSADYINRKGKGYEHPNHSIEPYLKVLKNHYLVNKTEEHLMNNFVNKYGQRYASNPQYEVMLRSVYRHIDKNTNIASLQRTIKNI